jgi:SAM-dependent methyltransferase
MSDLQDVVNTGHYARKQIHSRDPLIAWSHRRRFSTALTLAGQFAGQRVLDYGCGDGTFLGLLLQHPVRPASAVGAEIHQHIVEDCQRRFAAYPMLQFVRTDDLRHPESRATYDAIFCMEVFEHVVDPTPLIGELDRLLAPGGTLVVSVPIETGLPVIVKQLVRRVAGWRGIGHYPGTTGYTPIEFVKSVFAKSTQHILRPVFQDDERSFHDHKGFNWRVLRASLSARVDVVRTLTSPISWLGPQLSTQIWFIARKRGCR